MKLTRREFGALSAGALAGSTFAREAQAASASPLPAGAIDTHIHIVRPSSKYPMAQDRTYTPPEASVAQLKALRTEIGVPRHVVVQPSFYGFDNSCAQDAIAELGSSARGVAVVRPNVSEAELRRLDAAGFVGARLNFATANMTNPYQAAAVLLTLVEQLSKVRWFVQLNTDLNVINALAPILSSLTVPVVVDHMGNLDAALGPAQPGFLALLELARTRPVYVKLSAPYNLSKLGDYSDVTPLVRSL